MGSVSGYRGLVGPSKPGSELASRHVRSIASGLGNTTYNNCTFLLHLAQMAPFLRPTNTELLIYIYKVILFIPLR